MKKKALVICFFPAFVPASSGGELRLLNLYKSLSTTIDITLLTSTDFGARFEIVNHTMSFRELRFPKDEFWRAAYKTLESSGVSGDLSGLAFALAVSDPTCKLSQMAKKLAATADIVIHEFPFSEPIFADGSARGKEIYNSHNFEASLFGSIVHGPGTDRSFLKLFRLEMNLALRASLVFSTSPIDREKFRLFYGVGSGRLRLCPNGFDELEFVDVSRTRATRVEHWARPVLLFFGSAHHPNVEAGQFIVEVAADLPEFDFVLAGGVCSPLQAGAIPANVELVGSFDPAMKMTLLERADVFINPVVLGSGTSVKALEALGAGLPMVSTPEGVRGLDLIDGAHASIVPRAEFANAIVALVGDRAKRIEMGSRGCAFARERFTWRAIAEGLAADLAPLENPISDESSPCVIAINDYPALDADSGGKARLRGLLGNLQTDVILISFGEAHDVVLLRPGFLHVTVAKTTEHRSFETALNQGQRFSVNDCVASLFIAANRVFAEVTCEIAVRSSVAIIEHCYVAPMIDVLRTVRPDIPIIYSAHNVEAQHRIKILKTHAMGAELSSLVCELEERLVEQAQLIVCCTQEDADYFSRSGVETIIALNGCDVPSSKTLKKLREIAISPGDAPRVGFMGSGHGPNVEAANFIVDSIAPNFPSVTFEFMGGVCSSMIAPLPPNVKLHGQLDDRRKAGILANWTLALNPVMSGGGSSLKLPDFMAHELATINTPTGARGFLVAEHRAGEVATRPMFNQILAALLADPGGLRARRENAYRYALEQLNWTATTAAYRKRLRAFAEFGRPPTKGNRSSLLVVTYRYTEPALGGAEEYLIEVLRRLRSRFEWIDLAAVDVGNITNEHHFACGLTNGGQGASARLGELFDRALYFPVDEKPSSELIERSRRLERVWTRDEFSLFEPFAGYLSEARQLRLFCGFYPPESQGGVIRRWTGPAFGILVPSNTRVIRLKGFAAREKQLSLGLLRLDDYGRHERLANQEQIIDDWFSVNLALPPLQTADRYVLLCEVDEHVVEGDHRPFGVLLEGVSALHVEERADQAFGQMEALRESRANFLEDKELQIRSFHFEAWLDNLRAIALARSSAAEADFAATRGPHSKALQAWLAENGELYDCVLVQGIPFDTIPSTVETLKALPRRPRIVTLPHFHGDDRFYHWRRYYDSFAAAAATLLFSQSVAESLDLRGKLSVVPGGGVTAIEHADVDAVARFREVHSAREPFFLVLGRKTGSKGYRTILNAHTLLRQSGPAPDLLLIGPDEDSVAIDQPGVLFLGRQPRQVIRGALSECLGLVTMSTSESFGIVLCEAWLFGKPVIANRACSSFRELVADGKTGLLVGSEVEVAAAMRRLALDAGERERLGRAGFEEVQELYTWEKVADAVSNVVLANQ